MNYRVIDKETYYRRGGIPAFYGGLQVLDFYDGKG